MRARAARPPGGFGTGSGSVSAVVVMSASMRERAVFIGSIPVWDTIGTLPLPGIEIVRLFRPVYCRVMGRKAPRQYPRTTCSVVHLSTRKEGREDTGVPCINTSILHDIVDPGGGDDLRSLPCAAVRNDLSEASQVTRGCQRKREPRHGGDAGAQRRQ